MPIARFWEYLQAAGIYWWAGLAVLLGIERLAERAFPGFWKVWVDPWFTPARRWQALVLFALLAVLYGNFRAWDEERNAKERIIAERSKPPLDVMALYQGGVLVASIIEPRINVKENTIDFPMVTASRELATNTEFEFRSWRLLCDGRAEGMMSFGAMKQISYPNFTCRIEGTR